MNSCKAQAYVGAHCEGLAGLKFVFGQWTWAHGEACGRAFLNTIGHKAKRKS